MMRPKFNSNIRKFWPIGTLSIILIAIIVSNFNHSSFLMGWDNLMPELNPILNLKRSLFSVWQESHGLGILAGNAYAADLPHQIIVYLLSLAMPINFIRWVYVFSMLALGAYGSYFLIRKLIPEEKREVFAFLGSAFYLLNLATIQNFFIPFEPFITFFGFLPFLLFSAINFISLPSRRNFLIFILVNLFSLSLAQVPTIFLVYLFFLTSVMLGFFLENRKKLRPILKILLGTFLINAFWLMPFIYFLVTASGVAFDAKINQMSTDVVYSQNKEFGNISDVMLLKGFWFNNVDLTRSGYFEHMFDSWRNHLSNPLVSLVGYFLFATVLFGAIWTLLTRKFIFLGFFIVLIAAFILLSINTPPFSYINSLLRDLPIFNQVFRSPFTKFSTVASLSFAVFFALGIQSMFSFFSRKNVPQLLLKYTLGAFLLFFLLLYTVPVFKGGLFYERVKSVPPKEYSQLFDFFKKQDPGTRIATFPQYTFWGWTFYDWGYGGSGFLWFGLPQPTLERLFDVWGRENENYYWEITQALHSKDSRSFSNVLKKYQVNWLIIDSNIVPAASQKVLFIEELKEIIEQNPEIRLAEKFGNIEIYNVGLGDNPKSFVFTEGNLPNVNGYTWGSDDFAYKELGNYVSTDSIPYNYIFPYRSLFSNKSQSQTEFKVVENDNSIDLVSDLPSTGPTAKITIPSFNPLENLLPVNLIQEKRADGSISLNIQIKSPEVIIDDGSPRKIWEDSRVNELVTIPEELSFPLSLNVNGILNIKIVNENEKKIIGSTFFINGQENTISLSDSRNNIIFSENISTDSLEYDSGRIEINVPYLKNHTKLIVRLDKIQDGYLGFSENPEALVKRELKNCDLFRNGSFSAKLVNRDGEQVVRFNSQNATACTSFYSPNLIHNEGYIIMIKNNNPKGRPMHFWVLNEDQDFAPIDTYLNKGGVESDSVIVLPPQEQFGLSYSFHFENQSIVDETINELGRIAIYPIPYKFLTSVAIENHEFKKGPRSRLKTRVYHPNEAFYELETDSSFNEGQTLVLSQSFNKGWKAYSIAHGTGRFKTLVPFLFGKEIKNHVLVNNWENGWLINPADLGADRKIVLVYLPQYLEFIGFFLAVSGLFILYRKIR